MDKRIVSELNADELRKVFAQNGGLRELVFDDMQDSEMMWVNEQLDTLTKNGALSSWSIGICNRDQHITVRDGKEIDFIENLKALQRDYCFLPDSDNEYIDKV